MAETSQSLTEGRLGRQILLFGLPLMFSNLLQVFFNMSDIAVVGRFAGASALGSVGSTATLVTLFTGFLIGLSNGVNVLVARYLGAQSQRDTEETVHTSAIICAIAGVLFLIIGLTLSRPLLRLLNTKDELIDGAVLYLRIYFLGMPALALFNFGNAVMSASGNTKKPLMYLLAAGIINVILNLFFVIVCHMGVAGVGIASAVSQYISAILILGALVRSSDTFRLRPSLLKLYPEKAKFILSIGLPAGLQNAIFAIANLFIQSGVNSFDTTTVEGISAATNSDAMVYDVMAAFYTACSSFMSQNFGAGKRERVLKSYFISLIYSFCFGGLLGGLLLIFSDQFLSLFTTVPEVIAAGKMRLLVMSFSYPFSAFMDCSLAASRGLGKSFVPMLIVILGSCVFRIIWIYTVFAHFHTVMSLFLLYIFSWSITGIAETVYFAHSYKKIIKHI